MCGTLDSELSRLTEPSRYVADLIITAADNFKTVPKFFWQQCIILQELRNLDKRNNEKLTTSNSGAHDNIYQQLTTSSLYRHSRDNSENSRTSYLGELCRTTQHNVMKSRKIEKPRSDVKFCSGKLFLKQFLLNFIDPRNLMLVLLYFS